jgi:hypothetical protein
VDCPLRTHARQAASRICASVAAVAPDLLMLTMIIGFPAIDSGLFFAEI